MQVQLSVCLEAHHLCQSATKSLWLVTINKEVWQHKKPTCSNHVMCLTELHMYGLPGGQMGRRRTNISSSSLPSSIVTVIIVTIGPMQFCNRFQKCEQLLPRIRAQNSYGKYPFESYIMASHGLGSDWDCKIAMKQLYHMRRYTVDPVWKMMSWWGHSSEILAMKGIGQLLLLI